MDTNTLNQTSYLKIIVGPMFSGKTTALLKIYQECLLSNISVSIINHEMDKRYHETLMTSHNNIQAPCIQTKYLKNVWNTNDEIDLSKLNNISSFLNYKKLFYSDVILINEAQFFPDLFEVVIDMLKKNKKIYICGLDSDFERKKFGQIFDLIPFCNDIEKLKAKCSFCSDNENNNAVFSMRLTKEKEQMIIGNDIYKPVCRICYENHNKTL